MMRIIANLAAKNTQAWVDRLLWPPARAMLVLRQDNSINNMGSKASPSAITLTLTIDNEGTLVQVLSLGDGQLRVGETPFFHQTYARQYEPKTSSCAVAPNISNLGWNKNPLAPKVWQAIRSHVGEVSVLCSPDLLDMPWVSWFRVELGVDGYQTYRIGLMPAIESFTGSKHPSGETNRTTKVVTASWPERAYRQVTSLSYDLVSSTELMATLGIENYAILLAKVHDTFAHIFRQWQGVADAPQGDDGCMCYFGALTTDSYADHAGLRAALQMRRVAKLQGWRVRIGVASGMVAVDGNQPVGLSVHLAARLQKLAQNGCIYVSEDLAERLHKEFEFDRLASQELLKGFDGLHSIFELIDEAKQTESTFTNVHQNEEQQNASFVGRSTYLAILNEAWRQTVLGKCCDLLLMGEPGIGKSSLVRRWQSQLGSHHQAFVLACSPHDYRHPFASLVQWIAREIGYRRVEQLEERLHHLEKCLELKPQWQPCYQALLYLFDAPNPNKNIVYEDPIASHQQVINMISQWLVEQSKKTPILLVIEDYQWMDASTSQWVEAVCQAMETNRRIMLLVTQRPPMTRQLIFRSRGQVVEMEPLTVGESEQLIAALSPQMFSDRGLAELVGKRAHGNPLFLKETVRLFNSREYHQQLQKNEKMGVAMPVPGSLQDLLMLRLDQVGSVRQIAQIGSVLGQDFSLTLLEAVVQVVNPVLKNEASLNEAVRQLVSENIWVIEDENNQSNIAFSHALLRDVSYQSMWETDRKKLHSVAATVLQKIYSKGINESTMHLARHLAAAGETEKAVTQLLSAGKQSKKKGAHLVATQTMETALELMELQMPSRDVETRKVEAHLALAGQALITEGYGSSVVIEHYRTALELSQKLRDDKAILRSQLGLESYHFMRGDFKSAHRLLRDASVTAQKVKHPLSNLQYDWAHANLLFYEGALQESAQLMQDCINQSEQYELGKDLIQNPRIMASMYRAFSLLCLGQTRDALSLARHGCVLAEQGHNRLTKVQAYGIAAMVEHGCGHWTETLQASERAIASCQPGEYALWLAHAGVMRGVAMAQLGDFHNGVIQMRESHARWAAHGGNLTRSYYWVLEAEILLKVGDVSGAREATIQAQATVEKISERYYASEAQRVAARVLRSEKTELATACAMLLAAFTDAQNRQLHGLALRCAIDIYEFVQEGAGAMMGSKEDAQNRLQSCLAQVQADVVTADVMRAKACLHDTDIAGAKIMHLNQFTGT